MLGAIIGDILSSSWEPDRYGKPENGLFPRLCRFSGGTILTLAIADAIMEDTSDFDRQDTYIDKFHEWYDYYPNSGFSDGFSGWARQRRRSPYSDCGFEAALRVTPIGWAYSTSSETLREAQRCTEITHDQEAHIRSARTVAMAIFLARQGSTKQEMKCWLQSHSSYDLSESLETRLKRPGLVAPDEDPVGPALIAFLGSRSFEHAIRSAQMLSPRGSLTPAITGAIAEPFYNGVPEPIVAAACKCLDNRQQDVVCEFQEQHGQDFG